MNKQLTEQQQKEFNYQVMKKLEDLIYIMTQHHPFYASILSKFIKRISDEVPVAAVTWEKAFPVLLINSHGFSSYSNKEKIFILLHEIRHITDLHHMRGKGLDPGIVNIAADIEINQQIESTIAYRPADCLMPHHFDLPNGLSMEEYYNILINRDEPIEIPEELKDTLLNDIINGSGDGDQDGDQNGNNNGSNDSGDNEGNGSNQDGNQSSDQNGGQNSGGGGNQKSKAPGFEKLHPHWKEVQEMSEDLVKGLTKSIVKEAMTKSAGNIPGELKQAIKLLFEPQVKWNRVLRTFTSSLLSTNRRSTWSRPNRRFGSIKMGSLRKKELNLLVAIDTSGSLCQKELSLFLTEIKGIKDQTDANITIVQCDTHIRSLQKWEDVDIDNFEVFGRGGTDLVPVFEFAKNRQYKDFKLNDTPDGIIYLTDGWGPAPSKSNIRTLWVVSPGGRVPYSVDSNNKDVDWGTSVYLNDGNDI